MARQLRIEYAGAAYHVMARRNQGRPIYADDSDREMWLKTQDEACEKTGWRVHAYVMMGNHYHLLVETPEASLVAGMKFPKGMAQKRVLAWWLRERTTVRRPWLSEQLKMGDESGVSMGIRLVKEATPSWRSRGNGY